MVDLLQNHWSELKQWWILTVALITERTWWMGAFTSFALIAAAEIGDKSQLVCMTLATRHRPWPVLLGAVTAFSLLNLLAVIFGAVVAAWLPRWLVGVTVAVLFAGFGLHVLRSADEEEEDEKITEKSGHSIFITTLLMIFLAEFGDKTQIAVAGLSTTVNPVAVWAGATAALAMTSAIGVIAGRTVFQHLPIHIIHKLSGFLFLILAALALWGSVPWERVWEFIRSFRLP